MSASDYISKKKYEHMKNTFRTKDSSNEISKKKINVIRNVHNIDVFGEPIETKWFGVAFSNTEIQLCPDAHIDSMIHTKPLITKTPERTIEPALKKRLPPNICGSCFPQKDIYTGGPFIEGAYKFIACNQCGEVGGENVQYCNAVTRGSL